MHRYTLGPSNASRQSGIPRPSTVSAGRASVAAQEPPRPSVTSRLFGDNTASSTSRGSRFPGESSSQPSMANSARKSIFASGKKSLAALGLTPQSKRTSTFPSSVTSSAGHQRQSVGSSRPTGEDRPIADPSYQKKCIEKLNSLLVEFGETPVPPKFVTCPSSSDIKRVFAFLLNLQEVSLDQICPANKQWDTEVVNFARALGYPYPVAKRNLAVNSTTNNARGQLFGLIEWMVDCATIYTRTPASEILDKESEEYDYLLLALQKNPDSDMQSEVERLVDEQFPDQWDDLMHEKDEIQAQLHDLRAEYEKFKEVDKALTEIDNESRSFSRYLSDLKERLATFREKSAPERDDLERRKAALEKQITDITREQKETDELISSQEHNSDEVRQIWESLEQKALVAKQESDKSKEALRAYQREAEDAREQLFSDLQNIKAEFTRMRMTLSSIPGEEAAALCSLFESRQYKDLVQLLDSDNAAKFKDEFDSILRTFPSMLAENIFETTSALERAVIAGRSKAESTVQENQQILSQIKEESDLLSSLEQRIQNLQRERSDKRNDLNQKFKQTKAMIVESNERLKALTARVAEQEKDLKRLYDAEVNKQSDYCRQVEEKFDEENRQYFENLTERKSRRREQLQSLNEQKCKLKNEVHSRKKKNKRLELALVALKEREQEKALKQAD